MRLPVFDRRRAGVLLHLGSLDAALGRGGRAFIDWLAAAGFSVWQLLPVGPTGPDGYPAELWDLATGKIDHAVADYFKAHDYDLRDYLERNWATLGPKLKGQLHVFVGDMDTFYLNLAVYRLEEFLKRARPAAEAEFAYGRPLKPHGWQPWTNAELMRIMARYIERHRPRH